MKLTSLKDFLQTKESEQLAEAAKKSPLDQALALTLKAFKDAPQAKGSKFAEPKANKKGFYISAFDWGFWREQPVGSGELMTVSHKTETDAEDIVKALHAKLDKKFGKNAFSVKVDFEDQCIGIYLQKERPDTDFI